MTALTAGVVVATPRSVRTAVCGLAARQIRRGARVVLVVGAGMSALVAVQYRTTFAGSLDGPALQALAHRVTSAQPSLNAPSRQRPAMNP